MNKLEKLIRQQTILDYFFSVKKIGVEANKDILFGLLHEEFDIKTIQNDLNEFKESGYINNREEGSKYLWDYVSKDRVILTGMSDSGLPREVQAALITIDWHFRDLLPFTKILTDYINESHNNEYSIPENLIKWRDKIHISISTPELFPPEMVDNHAEYKIYEALLDGVTFNANYDLSDFDLSTWGNWKDFIQTKEKYTYHSLGILFKGKFKFLISKIEIPGIGMSGYRQFSLHKFSNVVINTNQVTKTGNDKLRDHCDTDILYYPEVVHLDEIEPSQGDWINLKFWASEGVRQYFEDNIYFELNEDFRLKRCEKWPGKLSNVKKQFPENNMVSFGFNTFSSCYEGKVRNTKKLRRWLMSIILGIEIIEPKHLKDEFSKILRDSTIWAHNKRY